MKKLMTLFIMLSLVGQITLCDEKKLSEKDLDRIANKIHTKKAWKNFDRFLTKCLIVNGITLAGSYFTPAASYKLIPQLAYDIEQQSPVKILPQQKIRLHYQDYEDNKKRFPLFRSLKENIFLNYRKGLPLQISKPALVTANVATMSLLVFLKGLVKCKRASDVNRNIFAFLVTDFWA